MTRQGEGLSVHSERGQMAFFLSLSAWIQNYSWSMTLVCGLLQSLFHPTSPMPSYKPFEKR